jgi:plastocyanin
MSLDRGPLALALGLMGLAAGVAGCGGSDDGSNPKSLPPGFYIRISNFTFAPLDLKVPPGGTVTVLNDDATPHSVTSEAAPGTFTAGAVSGVSFDTKPFSGTATFTLPMSAPAGTSIPYFCSVHRSGMATPNGTITVDPNAQPGPAP